MAKKAVKRANRKVKVQVDFAKPQVRLAKPAKTTRAAKGASKVLQPVPKSSAATSRGAKPAKPLVKGAATTLLAEPLTHRLDALLHTMRTIAQHEDELCTLLHDARRTGRVSPAILRELQAVLAALPAREYTDDLDAVLQMTGAA